jgi:hypothetical protein
VRPEGLGKLKKNHFSLGLEFATFRLIAQCLNHNAAACRKQHPQQNEKVHIIGNYKSAAVSGSQLLSLPSTEGVSCNAANSSHALQSQQLIHRPESNNTKPRLYA